MSLKRKLYVRGGSYETTIPIQLLFSVDTDKKNNVVFEYEKNSGRWYIDMVEDKDYSKYNSNIISSKSKKIT